MFRKEWQKVLVIIGIAVLFGLIILTAYHFVREPENVNIDMPQENPEKPTESFQNNSSLDEAYIREMAEEKRVQLRDYLETFSTYKVSEAFDDYTVEDDEIYMGLGESYLNGLHDLVTDELYDSIFSELTEGSVKATVALPEKIYVAKKDIFDIYYLSSAISLESYNQEELVLKKATDDKIEMVERLKYCREDMNDVCMRDDEYPYVLELVEGDYKIAKIR